MPDTILLARALEIFIFFATKNNELIAQLALNAQFKFPTLAPSVKATIKELYDAAYLILTIPKRELISALNKYHIIYTSNQNVDVYNEFKAVVAYIAACYVNDSKALYYRAALRKLPQSIIWDNFFKGVDTSFALKSTKAKYHLTLAVKERGLAADEKLTTLPAKKTLSEIVLIDTIVELSKNACITDILNAVLYDPFIKDENIRVNLLFQLFIEPNTTSQASDFYSIFTPQNCPADWAKKLTTLWRDLTIKIIEYIQQQLSTQSEKALDGLKTILASILENIKKPAADMKSRGPAHLSNDGSTPSVTYPGPAHSLPFVQRFLRRLDEQHAAAHNDTAVKVEINCELLWKELDRASALLSSQASCFHKNNNVMPLLKQLEHALERLGYSKPKPVAVLAAGRPLPSAAPR